MKNNEFTIKSATVILLAVFLVLSSVLFCSCTSEAEKQKAQLTEALEKSSLTVDQLNCTQLILVVSDGNTAKINCYDFSDGEWTPNKDISSLDGHVGKNGVNSQKAEGDGTTPTGLYGLGIAFGNKSDPGSALEYRVVTEDDYWVSDSTSPLYNTWVSGTEGFDTKQSEHLIDYPEAYAYGIVIGYNTEKPVPNAGSAIFFHCGTRPTAGCVSTEEASVINILKWLKPGAKILIV